MLFFLRTKIKSDKITDKYYFFLTTDKHNRFFVRYHSTNGFFLLSSKERDRIIDLGFRINNFLIFIIRYYGWV